MSRTAKRGEGGGLGAAAPTVQFLTFCLASLQINKLHAQLLHNATPTRVTKFHIQTIKGARLIRISLLTGLGLLSLLAYATAEAADRRVALLIGNAQYVHESTLKNPINDAELLQQTLKRELGFDEVYLVRNAGRTQMLRELAAFKRAAQGARAALIYYSGHGMMSRTRSNYLLPVDMPKIAADASIDRDVELDASAIAEDKLLEAVEGAEVQLVVLDACRDNGFRASKSGSKGLARRADQHRRRLVAYATEEGHVTEDGAGRNSTYAESLARHLRNKDWPVLKIFDEVAVDVERQTKNQQSPTRSGNLRIDVYLFNPIMAVNNSADPSPAPAVRTDPDEEAWKAAQAADSVEGYEIYVKDFASGRYVGAAKIKLAAAKGRHAISPPSLVREGVVQPTTHNTPESIGARVEVIGGRHQILADGAEVKDLQTNLIWQRCAVGQLWNGNTCAGEAQLFTFKESQSNARDGWRLPTIRELAGLIYCSSGRLTSVSDPHDGRAPIANLCGRDYSRPTIDTRIFPGAPSSYFWSTSDDLYQLNTKFVVHFESGAIYPSKATFEYAVRMVRIERIDGTNFFR